MTSSPWRDRLARPSAGPDALALHVDGGEDLTFGGWDGRARLMARALRVRGVVPGDRVALLFPPDRWGDFAAACVAVRACGAVPVLVSPGAAPGDLARALAHAAVQGTVHAPALVPPRAAGWALPVGDVAVGHEPPPLPSAASGWTPALVYPTAPLAPPRPYRLPPAEGVAPGGLLVHAWAPGTAGADHAVRGVLDGTWDRAATLALFDPDGLVALLERHDASTCGLTPALAAALVASGAPAGHDLTHVARVELTGRAGPVLRRDLAAVFPAARLVEVVPVPVPPAEGDPSPGDAAPVAVSQEPMVWHEQLTPGSFNLPCLVRRFEGPLDVGALGWALSELIRRHQPLRSTFEVAGGELRQVVPPPASFDLATTDLAGLAPAMRDQAVTRKLAEATTEPFDLVGGPLFAPRLVRLATDDHLLVVRLHHTVFDDWSVDLFRRELAALYTARREGAPSPLVEPRTSFADFCRRQRARLAGEAGSAQRAWWRRELHGAPLSVQLPIGGTPAPGEPLRLELPPPLAADLRALAPRVRATPFLTVLAAFSVLVARLTGLDDIVIATVVAHRNTSDVEPLVGCFTKKVPLRIRLTAATSFEEVVGRARAALLGALGHQDLAFDAALSEGLGAAAAEHGVVPQVSVVFQGEAPRNVKVAFPGVASAPFDVPGEARRERHFSSGADDDEGHRPDLGWGAGVYLGTFLILSLVETPGGMALVARGVFDRTYGRRLLEDFRALLAEVVAAPTRPVSELGEGLAGSAPAGDDVIDVRGFRARRPQLEAALARCPGVAEVALAVRPGGPAGDRLLAYVVPEGDGPPTLAQLRAALWAVLPGAPWPAAAVMVGALPRLPGGAVDVDRLPGAGAAGAVERPGGDLGALLAAMWREVGGGPWGPSSTYWLDFSFLAAVAQAREAGLPVTDDEVGRCRTTEMLGAAVTARASLAADDRAAPR